MESYNPTTAKIKATIEEYFNDFFEDIKFYEGNVAGRSVAGFTAGRNGHEYDYRFDVDKWLSDEKAAILYQTLGSIKLHFLNTEKKDLK